MDLEAELSLLDIVNNEQMNLLFLDESPPFSPLRLPNVTEPLTPAVEPAATDGINTNEWLINSSLNFDGNTVMENQSYGNEPTGPITNNKEMTLKSLEQNRKYTLSDVTKQIDDMAPLMSSVDNEEMVRLNALQLDKLFLIMQKAHELYVKELEDERDIELAQKWYDTHDRDVFEFKKQIIEYLSKVKKEEPLRYEAYSCKSGRSCNSRKSHSSVASSTSTRAKLIAAKAKSATLEVRATFLKEKQALRMATEELDLKQQIAEVKIEEQIYAQELNDGASNIEASNVKDCPNIMLDPSPINARPPTTQPTTSSLNPNASSFVVPNLKGKEEPVPPTSIENATRVMANQQRSSEIIPEFLKIQQGQTELTKMIVTHQLRGSLPAHKPPTFSGDIMEYPAFITAFETLIESKVKDSTELLYYLEQYTAGKAKEVIKGCFQRKSESSYQEAKSLLKKHYGDSFKIANAYVTKLSSWTPIKPNDGEKLQEFAIMLEQARTAMAGMEYMNDLNTAHVLRQLWEKLPRYLRSRWCERASSIRNTKGQMASFDEFVQFVTKQADLATDPIYSEELMRKENPYGTRRDQRNKGSSFATGSTKKDEYSSTSVTTPCIVCHKLHDLDQCLEFKKQSLAERKNLVKMKGLCFGCYSSEHIAKFCKQRKTCQVCKKRHPTALHDTNWKPGLKNYKEKDSGKTIPETKAIENQVNNARATVCDITEAGDTPINMGIIPVWLYHKDNPDEKVAVYALLDNASGGTFIKEESLEKLHVKGNDTKLLLTTMHGTKEVSTKAVEGLVVEHFKRDNASVRLPRTYVRQQIPVDRDEIPRTELLNKWPHLKKIAKQIPAYMENVEVGILVGLNCPSVLRPRDVIHGNEDEPYAVKSLLGWHINGPVNQSTREAVSCNAVHIMTNGSDSNAKGYVTIERKVKEIITPNTVKEMFEMEFSERERGVGLSQEDRKFLEKAENGIHHGQDAHYEMPLPFKNENFQLPNNRPAVEQRLSGLKKRLQNDEKYRNDYTTFMNGIIDKGYARKIEPDELTTKKGRVWYIPHHGVYHPQKPSKIRVVFDCSARYLGESLNDHLLQGPDLTNKLIGVLTRFRQEKIAFMADIEQMFYQVKVKEEDQDFLRFFVVAQRRTYNRTTRVPHDGTSLWCWLIPRMFQLRAETNCR